MICGTFCRCCAFRRCSRLDRRHGGVCSGVVVTLVNPDGDEKNAEDDEEEISAKEATGQKPVGFFVGQNATRAARRKGGMREEGRVWMEGK